MDLSCKYCGCFSGTALGIASTIFPPQVLSKYVFESQATQTQTLGLSISTYVAASAFWFTAKALNCRTIQRHLRFHFNERSSMLEVSWAQSLASRIARIGTLHITLFPIGYLITFALPEKNIAIIPAAILISSTTLTCGSIALIAITIDTAIKKYFSDASQQVDFESVSSDAQTSFLE